MPAIFVQLVAIVLEVISRQLHAQLGTSAPVKLGSVLNSRVQLVHTIRTLVKAQVQLVNRVHLDRNAIRVQTNSSRVHLPRAAQQVALELLFAQVAPTPAVEAVLHAQQDSFALLVCLTHLNVLLVPTQVQLEQNQ